MCTSEHIGHGSHDVPESCSRLVTWEQSNRNANQSGSSRPAKVIPSGLTRTWWSLSGLTRTIPGRRKSLLTCANGSRSRRCEGMPDGFDVRKSAGNSAARRSRSSLRASELVSPSMSWPLSWEFTAKRWRAYSREKGYQGGEGHSHHLRSREPPSSTGAAGHWLRWVRSWVVIRARCGERWRRSAVRHFGNERSAVGKTGPALAVISSPVYQHVWDGDKAPTDIKEHGTEGIASPPVAFILAPLPGIQPIVRPILPGRR